jgi:anaerobic ribonucleoside-triphosphate reductase activating protein
MRIAGTLNCSFINGYGTRYVIFCQGCRHHCDGCQNPDSWNFNGGKEISTQELLDDIKKYTYLDGITLSGGDPFFQQDKCIELLKLLPKHLNVWIYTGFKYKDIKHTELANMVDYIVDGKFEINNIITGKMYGSSNQQIIKIEKGLI